MFYNMIEVVNPLTNPQQLIDDVPPGRQVYGYERR